MVLMLMPGTVQSRSGRRGRNGDVSQQNAVVDGFAAAAAAAGGLTPVQDGVEAEPGESATAVPHQLKPKKQFRTATTMSSRCGCRR